MDCIERWWRRVSGIDDARPEKRLHDATGIALSRINLIRRGFATPDARERDLLRRFPDLARAAGIDL